MNDTEFQSLAAATLERIADALEPAYEAGALDDLVLEDGVLNVTTAQARVFVISKHAPTQQIWLASPLSGGLHFVYDATTTAFQLNDGSTLNDVLRRDFAQCSIEISL